MRGLSERAPQFLRDHGEQGGSSPARVWLLPTVLLLIQARLHRVTVRSQLGRVKEKRPVHGRLTLNCALS